MPEFLIQTLMGAVGSLGFAIVFHVGGCRLLFCFLGGGIGWGVYGAAGIWLENEAVRYLIATTVLTLYAEWMARPAPLPFHRPAGHGMDPAHPRRRLIPQHPRPRGGSVPGVCGSHLAYGPADDRHVGRDAAGHDPGPDCGRNPAGWERRGRLKAKPFTQRLKLNDSFMSGAKMRNLREKSRILLIESIKIR